MKKYSLFINGVYESVIQEILNTQLYLPEQILFLQPYDNRKITKFEETPPTVDDPVHAYLSITNDLANIHFTCEIVSWLNKTSIEGSPVAQKISQLIGLLQPNEGGLYNVSKVEGKPSINLLMVRRMKKIEPPFSVSKLLKISNEEPLSTARTTSGGWSYVMNPDF